MRKLNIFLVLCSLVFSGCKENSAPTCQITSPTNNASIEQTTIVSIIVDAKDVDNNLSSIHFIIDGVETHISTNLKNLSWNTSGQTLGTHTIKVTVYDTDGESASDQRTVTITPYIGAPDVAFTVSDSVILAGDTVTFTDQSLYNPTSWYWNFGNGATSSLQNPTTVYPNPGVYPVKLRATNSNGSDSLSKTQYIIVTIDTISPPVANFIVSDSSVTTGELVTFSDHSINSPSIWAWDFGDGSTDTVQDPSHTYSTAGAYSVKLIATNAYGSDTKTKTNYIVVTDPVVLIPDARFTANDSVISEGDAVTFIDQSTNSPNVWKWDFGDGMTSSSQNPTHFYSNTGSFTVTLIASNNEGSDTLTKTGYVLVTAFIPPAPIAGFLASNTIITAGNSVNFTDMSLNNPINWSWDFGDGGSATYQNPTHNYSTAGTYSVTLIATNAGGSDTLVKSGYILVNTSSSTSACPETPTLTDMDGNEYPTILIGTQCWMAENLSVTKYPDGTPIPHITDDTEWANLKDTTIDDAYCYYNNNSGGEAALYGALYTWAAAMGDNAVSSDYIPSGVQGVCPNGWHLPSDGEWTELTNYLVANGYNFDGTTSENKIGKSMAATSGWNTSTTDGNVGTDQNSNNSTGFNGISSGRRWYSGGSFTDLGVSVTYWSSTEYSVDITMAYRQILHYNYDQLDRYFNPKSSGYSVRCLKD